MVRLLKLAILAACLIVPFWPQEGRLRPGQRVFALGDGYRFGEKLTVLSDDESGPGRDVAVKDETGGMGKICRVSLHPINTRLEE